MCTTLLSLFMFSIVIYDVMPNLDLCPLAYVVILLWHSLVDLNPRVALLTRTLCMVNTPCKQSLKSINLLNQPSGGCTLHSLREVSLQFCISSRIRLSYFHLRLKSAIRSVFTATGQLSHYYPNPLTRGPLYITTPTPSHVGHCTLLPRPPHTWATVHLLHVTIKC